MKKIDNGNTMVRPNYKNIIQPGWHDVKGDLNMYRGIKLRFGVLGCKYV